MLPHRGLRDAYDWHVEELEDRRAVRPGRDLQPENEVDGDLYVSGSGTLRADAAASGLRSVPFTHPLPVGTRASIWDLSKGGGPRISMPPLRSADWRNRLKSTGPEGSVSAVAGSLAPR